MIEIGRYLQFIMSLVGMTLSVNANISEEDIARFLNHILTLHNDARRHHGVAELLRTDELDVAAFEIRENINILDPKYPDTYGINISTQIFKKKNKLNIKEAQRAFSKWYRCGERYCYFFEPLDKDADQFTRIVWSSTIRIGMTFRTWNDVYSVLVIYDPPGNIKGQYTSNVMLPPSLALARNPDDNNMLLYQGDQKRFLHYILELHNTTRQNYGAQILESNQCLNNQASTFLFVNNCKCPEYYEMNTIVRSLHVDFKMNATEAEAIFSEWCNDEDAFTKIVSKDATMFGIAMRRFTNTYTILALYSSSVQKRLQFINNDEFSPYIYEGESSEHN